MKPKNTSLAMLFLLTSGLITAGCASLGYADPPVVDDISVANIFNIDEKNVETVFSDNTFGAFINNKSTMSIETIAFAMANKSDENNNSESTESQKTLGALMIKASDDACYKYLTEISTVEKGTKSVLGTVSI